MRRRYQLLDLDPDLGTLVPVDRRDACRRELDVEVRAGSRRARGPREGADPEHAGLLLIEGVIAREVVVSDTVSTELLGPGDVVRPWSLQDAPGLLQATIRWTALTECSVALLDRRFARQLARWPEVNVALMDRINERAHRLATTQAISQLNKVDRRLLSLFWHLAERWGRITPDGVVDPADALAPHARAARRRAPADGLERDRRARGPRRARAPRRRHLAAQGRPGRRADRRRRALDPDPAAAVRQAAGRAARARDA